MFFFSFWSPQRRRLLFLAAGRWPLPTEALFCQRLLALGLFSLLLLPLLPLLTAAASLYGCNFLGYLGYLAGSIGCLIIICFLLGQPFRPFFGCHYQLGVFLRRGWPSVRFL